MEVVRFGFPAESERKTKRGNCWSGVKERGNYDFPMGVEVADYQYSVFRFEGKERGVTAKDPRNVQGNR